MKESELLARIQELGALSSRKEAAHWATTGSGSSHSCPGASSPSCETSRPGAS
jgi:hypothetical protein